MLNQEVHNSTDTGKIIISDHLGSSYLQSDSKRSVLKNVALSGSFSKTATSKGKPFRSPAMMVKGNSDFDTNSFGGFYKILFDLSASCGAY